MKKVICTVRDDATRVFITPLACLATVEQARREMVEYLKSGDKSPVVQWPEQFGMYQFGTFDDESGAIEVFPVPELLFRVSDLVVRSS